MAKIPDIKIKFSATGAKGLNQAIKTLDRSTKALINTQAKIVRSTEKQDKGILDTNHSTRILGGSFAVLRSKMLLASFAAGLFTMTIGRLIKAQAQQEEAEKKLSISLGKRSEELLKFASAQQKVTTFGDEETIQAMSLIGAYTNNEEAIKKLTQASMDLAIAKGMDLNSAVDLVAKSVFSSTNALSRYGVVIEGATGSTNRLEMATEALGDMYGGQAKAQAETMSGAIKALWNAIGDTAESMGKLLSPVIITVSNNLRKASEHADDFLKGLNNLIEFGDVGGIEAIKKRSDGTIDGYNNMGKAIREFTKEANRLGLDTQELHKKALMNNEGEVRSQRDRAIIIIDAVRQEQAKLLQMELEHQKSLRAARSQTDPDSELEILGDIALTEEEILFLKIAQENHSKIDLETRQKMANFASQTAASMMTSAVMGDDISESLKRAVIQLMIMVAQAKLYDMFMTSASGGSNKITAGIAKFLFGHDGGAVTKHGIKRFHSGGLASDETPAILQQGEFVLSKNAVQSIGLESARAINEGRGGRGIQIHIHGGVVQEDYITNELIPAINKAKALA